MTKENTFCGKVPGMTSTRAIALFLCCLGLLPGLVACSAQKPWWDVKWEARVPITVEAGGGLLAGRPVILRWGDVSRPLGEARVRLSSLRLIEGDRPIPFQIDHRDAKGDFLLPGNLTLDPQDELVFVCPGGRRTRMYLYISEHPKPLASFTSGVTVTSPRRQRYHRKLATAGMSIAIQGTGQLDLSASSQANSARAAVVELKWKGHTLNNQGMSWGIVVNSHPYPSSEADRWRNVRLLVDGPVRKVVATNCSNSTGKTADGQVTWQANVTRYFSMFAGVPLYDVEDVAHCTVVQPNWTAGYLDQFHAGSSYDEHDVLWDGSTGAVQAFSLAEKNISVERIGSLIDTQQVRDSWYAWFDEKQRTGVAVFYGPARPATGADDDATPARIRFRSGWRWYSTNNQMTFTHEGLTAPVTLRYRFRVMGLDDVSPEQVAGEYRLWENPEATSITIGSAERR